MAASEQADLSQFQDDLDGFGDQAFRSLDILARALHVKNAKLEAALQAIVSTAVTTLKSAQHAGLITVSRGVLVPQAASRRTHSTNSGGQRSRPACPRLELPAEDAFPAIQGRLLLP